MQYLIRTVGQPEEWVCQKLNEKPGIKATYEGFEGYVWIEFTGEPKFDAVKKQHGVAGFVMQNGAPAVRPQKRPRPKAFTKLVEGDEVIILDGVLVGAAGVVVEILDRIQIDVDFFGKPTRLQLYDHQVKKVEKRA